MLSKLEKPSGFSVKKARKLQLSLSKRVIEEDTLPPSLRSVAGVDTAYIGKYALAAVAVLDYSTLEVLETEAVRMRCEFPYIPTLLSFREAPAVLQAIKKVKLKPDVYLIDGQGVAHPYRCGLATHVGVTAGIPTIGVAKSLLCGEVREPKGKWASIVDKGEAIGAAVFTVAGQKPVYVSIGHMVSLNRAVDIVLHCVKKSRIPEPLRVAHMEANLRRMKIR